MTYANPSPAKVEASRDRQPCRKGGFASLHHLGWLGGIGILSSGLSLAQSPTAETVIPESAPAATSAPAIAPAPVAPLAPQTVAPPISAPEVPVQRDPAVVPSVAPRPSAAETYEEPSAIIFSERSSGCQTSARLGQSVSGLCAAPATPSPATTNSSPARGVPVGISSAPAPSTLSWAPSVQSGRLSYVPAASVQNYYSRTLRPPGRLGNGNVRLLFPLSIPAPITSLFGWRMHPVTGDSRFHSGTDIGAPLGTPVLAAYAGQVAIADFLGGYGLTVTMKHGNGTQETLYAHLSEVFVKPGEWVKQGQAIGRVGSTGLSTGPHLHFEFRQLTSDGWVAMDAGAQLEYALSELVKGVQVAQTEIPTVPLPQFSRTGPRLPNSQLTWQNAKPSS